jgi:hypothetical protein
MEPDPSSFDDDIDPTGLRDLLASVPGPGPMPDDVVTRIEMALRAERDARAAGQIGAGSDDGTLRDPAGHVVELASRRRPRWPKILLGGAAAAAAVVIAATTLPAFLSGVGAGTTTGSAAQPASAENQGDMKSGATSQIGSGASGPPRSPAPLASGSTTVRQSTSTQEFTLENWTALVATRDTAFAAEEPAEKARLSSVSGNTTSVSQCLAGLKETTAASVWIVLGRYANRPAAIIVTDTGMAYLVDATCSATDPRIIASAHLPG